MLCFASLLYSMQIDNFICLLKVIFMQSVKYICLFIMDFFLIISAFSLGKGHFVTIFLISLQRVIIVSVLRFRVILYVCW